MWRRITMGKTVCVYDAVFLERFLTLPNDCPSCGEPTNAELIEGNWNDVYDHVYYDECCGEEVDREWDKNRHGDGYYTIQYRCVKCGTELASGNQLDGVGHEGVPHYQERKKIYEEGRDEAVRRANEAATEAGEESAEGDG
jgi:rRNA maturation protein Nop10